MAPASSKAPARLVADIGGTNGRFAIVRDGTIGDRREYRNAEFPDLPALLERYFADVGVTSDAIVASACLAVAAPITDDGEAESSPTRRGRSARAGSSRR